MVYIILGTGFEEVEAIAPCDILRRGGVDVQFAGIGGLEVTGGHGITVKADLVVEDMDLHHLDMIVLPGGLGGVRSMLHSQHTVDTIRWAWHHDKYVAAICAAPTILAKFGITDHKKAVVYPGMEDQMDTAIMQNSNVAEDGLVLTGRAPGAAMDFGFLLLKTLKGAEAAEEVRSGMVYEK